MTASRPAAATAIEAATGLGMENSWHSNPWLGAALSAAAVLALGWLLTFSALRPHRDGPEPSVCALVAGIVGHHVEGVVFTYILSDSLTLSEQFGKGAGWSGFLLGAHKIGTATGSFILWCAIQYNADCWRAGRLIFRCAAALQLVGASVFAFFTIAVSEFSDPVVTNMLVLGRFIAGLGGGLMIFLTLTLFGRVVEPDHRRAWNVKFFLAGVSGLGVGPLCAALVRCTELALGCPQQLLLQRGLAVLPVLPLVQVPCLVWYPDLGEVQDVSQQVTSARKANACVRSLVVTGCIAMQVLRNLSISSLEAGASMLLENDYHWSSAVIGFTIAVVVGSVIFANFAYVPLSTHLSPYALQHAMIFVALLGTLVIGQAQQPFWLMLGVTLCFVASALSGGLIMAALQQAALPVGYTFDLNKAMLCAVVGADLLGRGGGPILARAVLAWGRRPVFAAVQTGIGVVLALLHEALSRLAWSSEAPATEEEKTLSMEEFSSSSSSSEQ